MSFTDSANTTTDPNPPPVNPNQQDDPLASPQGPQPQRPMSWPNQTLPALANQWNPQQGAQPDPNNPNAVAPDQTISQAGFTSGTPGPFALPAPRPQGPFGPFGPRPFQRAARQTFIPSAPNRPPEQWGTPPQFPAMPQMWEVPGIYHGIGGQLAQWGPGYVQPYAAMMGTGSGAWMRGYMRGQEALTNQQYAQMRMAASQTEQRMKEVANEYGQIYAIFGDGAHPQQLHDALHNAAVKFHDEHMLEALQISPQSAENLAHWYDSKHSDLHATNRAREDAERRREAESPYRRPDTQVSPAGVPTQTPAQSEETGGAAQPAGGAAQPAEPSPAPPAAGTPEPGGQEDLPPGAGWGDEQPGAPEAPSLAPTPPAAAPGAAGPPGPQVASTDPNFVPGPPTVDKPADQQPPEGGDRPVELPKVAQAEGPGAARTPAQQAPQPPAQRPDLTVPRPQAPQQLSPAQQQAEGRGFDHRSIDRIAEESLISGKRPEQLDANLKKGNAVSPLIEQRKLEMQQQLDDLLRGKATGDDLVRRAKDISPRIGNWVEMMRKGELPMGKGGAAQFAKEPMATILALAKKAEPGMDLNKFQQRAGFQRWLTTGQGANQLIRLGTAYGHSKATLERLQNMPSRLRLMLQDIGTSKDSGMIAKMIGQLADSGDPEAARALGQLNTDLRTLAGEYMAIMAMTGAGSMTEREGIRESLDWSHPQRAIGQINEMMQRIKDREGALRQNAVRAGMRYDEIIQNIGSGTAAEGLDPAAGAAGMRQMELDRGGGYQDVPGHPGVRMRQVQ